MYLNSYEASFGNSNVFLNVPVFNLLNVRSAGFQPLKFSTTDPVGASLASTKKNNFYNWFCFYNLFFY